MTEWFKRRPGDGLVKEAGDGSFIAIIGDQTPDWVRTPPEMGGRNLAVISKSKAACPMCKDPRLVTHLSCAAGQGFKPLTVSECENCGFVWYLSR